MTKEENIIQQYIEIFAINSLDLKQLSQTDKDLERLTDFLWTMDKVFIPSLQLQVDIEQYSRKLINNAGNFLIQKDTIKIGLLSIYTNNLLKKESYISSFGVFPDYQGKNIAYLLLEFAIEYSMSKDMESIKLEVNERNERAIKFYQKNMFQIESKTNKGSFIMSRPIL